MATTKVKGQHGGVRGANLSRSSILFGGPFGRIFRALPAADFGVDDAHTLAALSVLAAKMTSEADPADPKDGPDNEEGGFPAAYTYFGQFVDHDLTFDPASSLQKQNDPDALVDYRTPRFDMDNVYGRGPDDQPYLYEDGIRFILGKPLTGAAANPRAHDLPRSNVSNAAEARRAIIGDPRNDENVIVSQFQGLIHRFHNKMADDHSNWTFAQVQQEVRFHYQWVVLNDYLPIIVSEAVMSEVLPHVGKGTNTVADPPRLEFFRPRNEAFMPLEFSAAAYRFGHSLVRPGYRLSETVGPIAIFAGDTPGENLKGFREFPSNWAIDWNHFIDLEPRPPGSAQKDDPGNITRTQLAYKMDTSLVSPLGQLPAAVAVDPSILALRNLERGWRMRLPNGQDVARAMGLVPLEDKQIEIGKFSGDPADILGSIDKIDPAFANNCPLWTYVLAETVESEVSLRTTTGVIKTKTRKLGPVGGRIVAETIAGILLSDSSSYLSLNPLWKPSLAIEGKFRLRELIARALQG